MSHEIRTPLNAVIGLGYLLEHTPLSEDQRQLLTKIQFGGRALLGVINNVLDLSKIEAGEMFLEEEPFDLPELVRDLGQMLAPQAAGKGIELCVEADAALPRIVRGDASRLRQVLTNLLGNSLKFTEQGRVHLKVFGTERTTERLQLRCTVEDSGIGMEPEALARLFTPFTQADASTTRRFGGTGLGLSITRRFVELMGGEIGVTSSVGVGSRFWIEVPLRIAHDMEAGLHERGLKVLIVDTPGEAPGRLLGMARALGWSPQMVETGQQLFGSFGDKQAEGWPDVLILELRPPDTNAHQLISRLESECAHGELPPLIIVADLAQSEMQHEELMRKADVLLVRPVTSSALFNAVNAAVVGRPETLDRVLQSTSLNELSAQWLSGVRVLVVDDSEINLEVARRILEKQGAIVATRNDGMAALAYVRDHAQSIDVVLMDVQMPVLDGNEATHRIRSELNAKSLPIVALTAGALVGERQRTLDAGMNDFISKPFDPQSLIRKVRRLAEEYRRAAVPMVFLAANRNTDIAESPFGSGVDAKVVQRMFGEDLDLFTSLLRRMLKDFADFALPISAPIDNEGLLRGLAAKLHKLKGSAGMLGAIHVMRLAGAAEAALNASRPGNMIEGILKHLSVALTTLREEAEPILRQRPERAAGAEVCARDAAAVPYHPGDPHAQIDELCSLLDHQNLEAMDRFAALSPMLAGSIGHGCFEQLREAVEELDFKRGAVLLRNATNAA